MSILKDAWAAALRSAGTVFVWWEWARFGLGTYRVQRVEDLPARLKRKILYVVVEGETQIHASMACPRGRCGDAINLNLLPDDHPVWSLEVNGSGWPSTRPSIWRRTSCGCHFWIRNGKIDWC